MRARTLIIAALICSFQLDAEVPVVTSIEKITTADELCDGLEFYLVTGEAEYVQDSNTTVAPLVSYINQPYGQLKFLLASDATTKMKLKATDEGYVITFGDLYLTYQSGDKQAVFQSRERKYYNIAFKKDGRVSLVPTDYKELSAYAKPASGARTTYRMYFLTEEPENSVPLYMAISIKEKLAVAPTVTVAPDSLDITVEVSEGCVAYYAMQPVQRTAQPTTVRRRVPADLVWKEWTPENWNTDRLAITEPSDVYVKAVSKGVESDIVQARIKSLQQILTGLQEIETTPEAPAYYNLQGQPMAPAMLERGVLYVRRTSGITSVIRYIEKK